MKNIVKTGYTLNNRTVYAETAYNPFQKKTFVIAYYLDASYGVLKDKLYSLIGKSQKKNFQGSLNIADVFELD